MNPTTSEQYPEMGVTPKQPSGIPQSLERLINMVERLENTLGISQPSDSQDKLAGSKLDSIKLVIDIVADRIHRCINETEKL